MQQLTLFSRRARLRRLLEEADAASDDRRRLARVIGEAEGPAHARELYAALDGAGLPETPAPAPEPAADVSALAGNDPWVVEMLTKLLYDPATSVIYPRTAAALAPLRGPLPSGPDLARTLDAVDLAGVCVEGETFGGLSLYSQLRPALIAAMRDGLLAPLLDDVSRTLARLAAEKASPPKKQKKAATPKPPAELPPQAPPATVEAPPAPEGEQGLPFTAAPACPPSSRDLGVVEVAPGASGRLVMDAAGRYRLLIWDREGAFGTWHDPERVDGYSPTREEIAAACTAAAGVRLWEPDWYPCVEAPAGRAEFSLRFDPAEHPERWRFVSLVHLGKRWSAVDEQAETLGELAAMLEGGRKLANIKGVREKDAPELVAALVDLWVKETEEGGRGYLPGWLSLLASQYPTPAAPEEPAEGEAPQPKPKPKRSHKKKPAPAPEPTPDPRPALGPDNRCTVEVPGGGVLHVLWDEPRGILEAEARQDFGNWHDHTAAEMTPDERAVGAAISDALGWPVEVESYTVTTRGLPRFGLRRVPRQQAGLFGAEGGAP